MAKYEYQHVCSEEYCSYLEKANALLFDISIRLNKPVGNLCYGDIINYFQTNYNLHFTFFAADPKEVFGDDEWPDTKFDKSWIIHKDTVKDADFCFLDSEIVDRISGVTIPKGCRTLIMINQDRVYPRIIFTIMHELSHYYFHIRDNNKKQAFVSLTNDHVDGRYSEELIPFENEANIIGSILFCPGERLEYMLAKRYTFKEIYTYVGMSEPAMHNRLLNYFEHVLKLPPRLALNFVMKFRADDYKIRKTLSYKVQERIDKRNKNDEARTLIRIQAEYIDKLKDNSFWSQIIDDDINSSAPSIFKDDD